MIKAFFVDFYGTVVHEDGAVVGQITEIIRKTGDLADAAEIGAFWWNDFQKLFLRACGEAFETQRALEKRSLEHTLQRFHSSADAGELSELLFAHWVRPPIFADAEDFFAQSPLPIHIVSNIDTADIREAIRFHGLKPAGVFTSEDARAYKPRRELFELALKKSGLRADEVIHVGDSLGSDVKGASALGIRALWLNRSARPVPEGVTDIAALPEAFAFAV